jgi:osmoprotectant transport system permease protein
VTGFVGWFLAHLGEVGSLTWSHLRLAVIPLLVGLALSVPLGALARRSRRWYAPIVGASSLLYTIPSLALFVALPAVLGTQILDPLNVVVALTVYTVALLVRTVADGLGSVPEEVRAAAAAMGYRPLRRFWQVELPLAVPVIAAGTRVAAVSNVSLVSVAALIGVPQLGQLFTDGFQRFFYTPLIWGIVLSLALALALDGLILAVTRALTPWLRAGSPS